MVKVGLYRDVDKHDKHDRRSHTDFTSNERPGDRHLAGDLRVYGCGVVSNVRWDSTQSPYILRKEAATEPGRFSAHAQAGPHAFDIPNCFEVFLLARRPHCCFSFVSDHPILYPFITQTDAPSPPVAPSRWYVERRGFRVDDARVACAG